MTFPKQPVPLRSKPGIQRDGTMIDSESFTDGEWVRFQNGKPRKIGGYKWISSTLTDTPLLMKQYFRNGFTNVLSFHESGVDKLSYDKSTFLSTAPEAVLTIGSPDAATDWSAGFMYDTVSGKTICAALLSYDLDNLESDLAGVLYKSADVTTLASGVPFAVEDATSVSGGCCVVGQFLFLYGSDGLLQNSDANKPFNFTVVGGSYANTTYLGDGQKIVYGAPIRSGAAPSGLFWSLDAVHKATFTGGSTIWSYATIGTGTSILSKKSVVEYDGNYFWPGVDRFYVGNSGGVQELPNGFNSEFFFTDLNPDQVTKIWGTKIPRFGEIWWFYPSGSSTECDHAIVYNVREKFWFDLPIGRTAGIAPVSSAYPIWADATRAYLHERGKNEITDTQELAIRSSFTTATVDFMTSGEQPNQVYTQLSRIEPDFEQVGDMTVQTVTQRYANSTATTGDSHTFSSTTEKVDIREQSRIMRLKFGSNTLNGDYWMGETFLHLSPGDSRP